MKTQKLLCGLILLLVSCGKSKKFNKQAFFAQIASKEYVITQIEIPEKNEIVTDTFKKAYNAKNQLIVENDNIFFRYDSLTGKLAEKIICIDDNCEKLLTWKYQYIDEKNIIHQFLNGELQQTQELSRNSRKSISKVDSGYVFANQDDFFEADRLKKSQYEFFEKDKKNKLHTEQIYLYDSIGRISEIIRIFDKDSTNCIKIAFEYDAEDKKIKSLHSRPMPFDAKFSYYYTDHYKVYTYNTAGQLAEVKTYRNRKDTLTPFSITKYSYINPQRIFLSK